jgi:phosphate transport system substrate-binding protein
LTALLIAAALVLRGAGATFPEPVYRHWFAEYERRHPEVHFEYEGVGSGEGARRLADGAVDFAASDPPLSDEQLARQPGVVHVPAFVGCVAVAYQLPGVERLHFNPEVLAGIFEGKIARWTDPFLAAVNPGARLPDLPVTVVARADESGTTQLFTTFLSSLDAGFSREIGTGKLVRWPKAVSVAGSGELAKKIAATPGAIGYVELGHARDAALGIAALQNAAGVFIEPSSRSISRAAVGVRVPADFRVLILNPRGEEAYPIATFTFLLFDPHKLSPAKRAAWAGFLDWALHDGQNLVEKSGHAPLPGILVRQATQTLESIPGMAPSRTSRP